MLQSSIRNQLLLVTTLPLLFVVLLVSVFMMKDSIDVAEEELNKRGIDLVTQAASMSEFYFYTGNREKLAEVAHLLKKVEGVVYIRFIDKLGKITAFKGDIGDRLKCKVFSKQILNQSSELDDFSKLSGEQVPIEKLGEVEVGLSKELLSSKKQGIYIRVIIIALLAIVLSMLFSYFFSRKLTRSLTSLIVAARDIKAKNFSSRSAQNGTGEVVELQIIFNQMAQSLEKNEYALQSKIDTATQSLNKTVATLSEKNQQLAKLRQETINLERSKAISDERTRIMKDMHDGIGGQLVITIALIDKEEDSEHRNNISATLRECLDDLRLIINSLNVTANMLSELLADFKYRQSRKIERLGIELEWQIDDSLENVEIPPQHSLHILRILQESFTNIYKHSDGNCIKVHAFCENQVLTLSILDNGTSKTESAGFGQGVNNMHWRAQQINADLKIVKHLESGYEVILVVPIP